MKDGGSVSWKDYHHHPSNSAQKTFIKDDNIIYIEKGEGGNGFKRKNSPHITLRQIPQNSLKYRFPQQSSNKIKK